ncbi:DUF7344 domain-containing protein [Haloarchaeobius sp. HRN-SO-5]|uniref:DUF7344 domain-containing protein n=1 Tax=Haloarchaeobius sp. HRN-SO-5 TaxID=3446118 RepID=UPI003EB856ED
MNHRPNSGPDAEREIAHVATDDRHRVLANERRRVVLEVLVDWRTPMKLEDLATEVASRERQSGTVDDVKISLHHAHLPLLDDVGAVEYDRDRNRVTSSRPTLEELTA